MSLKISVVVPSLNQAQFLGHALDSIEQQASPELFIECIVVDGGSTDGSRELLANRAVRDNVDLRWTSEPDLGQTDAINRGLRRCSGQILAYLNSDDGYCPGSLARVANAFASFPDRLWLTGDLVLIDEAEVEIQRAVRAYRRWWLRRFTSTRLTMLNFIPQPATFWRREAMDRIGLFDETLHYTMDYDYWLRLAGLSAPIYLDLPLARFRIHRGSKGGRSYRQQFREDYATACRYTRSRSIRAFHRMHNAAIILAYGVLK